MNYKKGKEMNPDTNKLWNLIFKELDEFTEFILEKWDDKDSISAEFDEMIERCFQHERDFGQEKYQGEFLTGAWAETGWDKISNEQFDFVYQLYDKKLC